MKNPKISVLIPVYNAQSFLREALDSVINQSFKNIKIICINDGSTDDSLSILNKYAKKDNRFKIFTKKNEGFISNTLNYGLTKISKNAKYIARMDADDICLWLCSIKRVIFLDAII